MTYEHISTRQAGKIPTKSLTDTESASREAEFHTCAPCIWEIAYEGHSNGRHNSNYRNLYWNLRWAQIEIGGEQKGKRTIRKKFLSQLNGRTNERIATADGTIEDMCQFCEDTEQLTEK